MRAKSQTGSIFLVSFLNIFKRKVNYLNQSFMCFWEKMTYGFQERIVTSSKRIEPSFQRHETISLSFQSGRIPSFTHFRINVFNSEAR